MIRASVPPMAEDDPGNVVVDHAALEPLNGRRQPGAGLVAAAQLRQAALPIRRPPNLICQVRPEGVAAA